MNDKLSPKAQWLLDKSNEAKQRQIQNDDANYMLKMKQAMIDNEKETARVTNQILGDILLKNKEPVVSKAWLEKKKD